MRTHTIHKISTTKKGLKRPKSVRILLLTQLAGVTRIELASAVLETVALPLCYTPIFVLCYYYIIRKNNHQFCSNNLSRPLKRCFYNAVPS